MANIIDGKMLSSLIKENLKEKVANFEKENNRKIALAVVLVGENPASQVYVRNKIKATEYVGMRSVSITLQETATFEQVKEEISKLANDSNIDGILVQLPLPKHLDEQKILKLIPIEKDVDGFLAENMGNLCLNLESNIPCTPFGIIQMLKYYKIDLKGKNAVVLGRSNIVGKPMAMLLLREDCTVTICHSKTTNLKDFTSNADILVAAIGRPNFVTEDMVKEGAVVIDVGINRVDGKLYGDVDYENVSKKASFITPVPGGVGPMTIAMLLENTYLSAVRRNNE